MYRPQFSFPEAPDGFAWQPCVYQFDQTNTPAMGNLALPPGVETGHVPLNLDHDSPFVLLAVKISDAGVNVLLFDPWTNQLMDDYVAPALYASPGSPATVLEGFLEVPAGAVFQVRFQGQG